MKAALQDRYGTLDVVRLTDVDRPVPADDQLLVRVRAASVNRADLDGLGPRPGFVRLFMGLRAPRNHRMGIDVAGVVESVGPTATRFKPGDEVFGDMFSFGQGTFAEYVCAPEKAFQSMPTGMTFEDAATLPHSAILALQGLRLRNGRTIRPGDKVLIDGASGNVGPFAVQIAKSMGAEVTGVCSTAKVDFVRSLGADHVIDYTKVDYTKTGERYDWIVDTDSHHSILRIRRAATQGRLRHARRDVVADLRGDAPGAADLAGEPEVDGPAALVEAVQGGGRRHPEGADRGRQGQAGDRSALPVERGRRRAPLGRRRPREGQGRHHDVTTSSASVNAAACPSASREPAWSDP